MRVCFLSWLVMDSYGMAMTPHPEAKNTPNALPPVWGTEIEKASRQREAVGPAPVWTSCGVAVWRWDWFFGPFFSNVCNLDQ